VRQAWAELGTRACAGQLVKRSITAFLARRLKLPVNEHKSKVAPISQCVFLGFTFQGTKLRWSDAAFEEFKHRVRELTGRSWGVSMAHRLAKLAQYARGWMGYFGISQYYTPIPELDEWLRRRVRMCYWKQWRRARTKVRHLLALAQHAPGGAPPGEHGVEHGPRRRRAGVDQLVRRAVAG